MLMIQVNIVRSSSFCRTCCVQKLFWMSKTISVHSMFSPCSELGIFMYWTCNSMSNLASYCGLVDAKKKSFWQRFTCTWNGWWGSWGCTTSEEAAAAAVWWKKSIPVWMTVENEFEEPSLALGHNCWLPLLGCWAWTVGFLVRLSEISSVFVELELVPGTVMLSLLLLPLLQRENF